MRITAVEGIGNDLRLKFPSVLDRSYELQSRTNLDSGSWNPLTGSTPGNGGVAQTTVSNAFNQPQQFYRIHQLP